MKNIISCPCPQCGHGGEDGGREFGFVELTYKWLYFKRPLLKKNGYETVRYHIDVISKIINNRDVRSINYNFLDDLFSDLRRKYSSKTVWNIRGTIGNFMKWCYRRNFIDYWSENDLPEVKYEMELRETVDKNIQKMIINHIKKISYDINPKIWFGIHFLAVYIAIRPGELLQIRESYVNVGRGVIILPTKITKTKKSVVIPLLDEDIIFFAERITPGSDLYFFRHDHLGRSGVSNNEKFGGKYFWKWWTEACRQLGIVGVDLYGGTRHSSACALEDSFTREEIFVATQHRSSKALDRYYRPKEKTHKALQIYKKTSCFDL